ncbi:MAG: hypothetical protein H7Y06_03675, partial [Opitutaceae bacterium]|nr:hypothetical protein [Opitutaceae bacterium]
MSPHDDPDSLALEQAWTALIARADSRIRLTRARSGLVMGAFIAVPLAALAAAAAPCTAAVPAMGAVRLLAGSQTIDTPPPQPSALCTPAQVRVSFSP